MMEAVIGISIGLISVVVLFPYEYFTKKNPYTAKKNRVNTTKIVTKNKNLEQFIFFSRKVTRFLKVSIKDTRRKKLETQIGYAGLSASLTTDDFIRMKVTTMLLTMCLFTIVVLNNITAFNIVLMSIATILGFFVPNNWLVMKAKNRQWAIQKEIPSILSSLAVVTDAGLNLLQAIEVVIEQNEGELCQEFRIVLEDVKIGINIKDAFIKLSQRSNIEELNYFVSAIVQGIEKGTSGITEVIQEQASESWEKRKHKAKELANKASMKLFLPLLLLVFPAFMIYLLGPLVFSLVELFSNGI